MNPEPSLKYEPTKVCKGILQGQGHVHLKNTQLQGIINHHGIKGGLNQFRDLKILGGILSIRAIEVRTQLLIILKY